MSCSEYLTRQMLRTQKIIDTRPRRDAGHQTEIVKRLAASGSLESTTAATACALVLNAPSTRSAASHLVSGGHSVQDTSLFNEYTAGQAVAQAALPRNAPPTYINAVCYSSTSMPDFNDRLAADAQLAAVQAAKNQYQRGYSTASCCKVCGEPVQFADSCSGCRLTAAQLVSFPTSGSKPRVPS
jgi:hypothetical protein